VDPTIHQRRQEFEFHNTTGRDFNFLCHKIVVLVEYHNGDTWQGLVLIILLPQNCKRKSHKTPAATSNPFSHRISIPFRSLCQLCLPHICLGSFGLLSKRTFNGLSMVIKQQKKEPDENVTEMWHEEQF